MWQLGNQHTQKNHRHMYQKPFVVFGFINRENPHWGKKEFLLVLQFLTLSERLCSYLDDTLMEDFYGLKHIKSRVKYNFTSPEILPQEDNWKNKWLFWIKKKSKDGFVKLVSSFYIWKLILWKISLGNSTGLVKDIGENK